jgi:hypothetical protein
MNFEILMVKYISYILLPLSFLITFAEAQTKGTQVKSVNKANSSIKASKISSGSLEEIDRGAAEKQRQRKKRHS